MTTGVVLPDAPETVAGERLFAVNGIEFTVADIARNARVGDRELAAFRGSAASVQEFRRAHGLLTADALTAWLERWGITPDQFVAWSEDPPGATSWTALVCSGAFDRAAAEVAAAAAAACELGTPPTSADRFDPAGWTERLAARVVTAEAVAAAIRTRRLAWTRVRATGVLAPTRAVAEELRHWVLDDGLDLEIAATQAGCRTFLIDGVLGELEPPALRAGISGALPDEVVGPVEAGPTWTVLRLESRTEPDPADPALLARARAAVSTEATERAVLRHVGA